MRVPHDVTPAASSIRALRLQALLRVPALLSPTKHSSPPRTLCFLVEMAAQEVDAQPSDTLTTLKTESETLKTKLEEERAKLHDVERKNREPYVCLMKTYVRIIAAVMCLDVYRESA